MHVGEHITSLDETQVDEYSTELLKERLDTAEKVLARTLWFNNVPIQEHANLDQLRFHSNNKITFDNFPESATWSKGNASDGTLRNFVEITPDPNSLPESLKHHFNSHLYPDKYDYLNSLTEIEQMMENLVFEIYQSDMDSHANLHIGERSHARYVSDTKNTIKKYLSEPNVKYEFTAFADETEFMKSWIDLVSSDQNFEKLHVWFDEYKTKKNFEDLQLSLDVSLKESIKGLTKTKETRKYTEARFIFKIVGDKDDKTKRRLALFTAYPTQEV